MYTGSMVGIGAIPFAVWGYVISHQRPPHFEVELNPKILAVMIGESPEDIAEAIEKFCQPDPESRTDTLEGRKLERIGTFLFRVVNGAIYDRIRNNEERKEYWREQKRKAREAKQGQPPSISAPVNPPAVPEAPPKPEKTPPVDCITIFVELNDLTGSKFRPEGASLAMLVQRLAQPDVSCDGVLQMVRRQVKLWKDDPKMREFLRPTTLFNNTKFNEYYAAREQPIHNAPVGKPNPRNLGIVTDGRSYGGGAKPRLERERQDLVPAVSQVGNLPAPGVNPAGV